MNLFGGKFGEKILTDSPFSSRRYDVYIPESAKEDSLVHEFCQTIEDGKNELVEICTDGFVEMAIKGNSDYKTSYELKDEADEKISSAQSEFEERCDDFNDYLSKLNDTINELYEMKVALAQKINMHISDRTNFPSYIQNIHAPSYTYHKSTVSTICDCLGVGFGIDIKGRKNSAKEYLNTAKNYEISISKKIAEINRMEAFLDTMKINLAEEQSLISALNESIGKRRGMPYLDIANKLQILIAEYILDADGKRNDKYAEALRQLKQISA